MSKEEKRAILTDWLVWAIGERIQDDFVLRSSVAFVLAKLNDLK